MPTPQEYLLSFDFTSFTSQFNILNRSYTDFGETIHKLTSQVSTDLKGIQEQADNLFQTFSSLGMVSENNFSSFERHLKQTSTYLDDYQKKSSEISQRLKDISNTDISKLSGALGGGQTLQDRLSDIGDRGDAVGEESTKKGAKEFVDQIERVEKKTEDLQNTLKKLTDDVNKVFADLWKIVEKEAKGARDKAKGVFSEITGGMLSGGGLIGMSLGLVLLGEREKQRKGAEAGEMRNVFEAGTAGITGKSQLAAAEWLSSFQERASHLYGIGKEEIQSVAKQFVDAGYVMTDSMGKFDNSLGEVGHNVITTTIGLDKLYNMATGTSAQNVNSLVTDFGESLSGASKKYMELAFAAQRSGMGVEKFINSVMSGSQALSQYGVEMTDIKDVMQSLQRYYKDMGLDKQAAGGQASAALQGLSIGGGSEQARLLLAQRMFPELPILEAKMKYEAGAERIAKGEDVGFFKQDLKNKVAILMEQTGGDKALANLRAQELGWFPNTTTFMAVWDLVKSGKIDQEDEVSKKELDKQMGALKDAYKTEGQQLTEIKKGQYELLQGLSTIGGGIMKILSGLVGVLVTGFHWLITLPDRLMMSSDDREKADKKISDAWAAATSAAKEGIFDIIGKPGSDNWGGLGQTGEALKGLFGPMFEGAKPAFDLVKSDVSGKIDQFAEEIAEFSVNQRRQEEVLMAMVDSLQSIAPALAKIPGGDAYGVAMNRLQLALQADYIRRTSQGGTKERTTRAKQFIENKVKRSPDKYYIKSIIPAEHIVSSASMYNGYYHGTR